MAKDKPEQLLDTEGKPMTFANGEPITVDHYDDDLDLSSVPAKEVDRLMKLLETEDG